MALKTTNKSVFNGPDLQPRQLDLIRAMSRHTYTLAYGVARGGKTYAIEAFIVSRALRYPGSDHLIVRATGNSHKTSSWKTMMEVLQSFGLHNQVIKNLTDQTITFPNGSSIVFGGVENEERVQKILGAEYATIFLNEATNIDYASFEILDSRLNGNWYDDGGKRCPLRLIIDCNPTDESCWIWEMFCAEPKRVPRTNKAISDPENYAELHFDDEANEHVDDSFYAKYDNRSLSAQTRFRQGVWAKAVQGALFLAEDVDKNRDEAPSSFDLVTVAIDPAMTNTPDSDETGIVVVGRVKIDDVDHYYPIADYSGRYHPHEWATIAVQAFWRHNAGSIVVEVNQGGDQNLHTIHGIDQRPTTIPVRAAAGQGKNLRAEPVAGLMKAGRIHHPFDCGPFRELEDQLLRITGDYDRKRGKSPDRLDAYVYAMLHLMDGKDQPANFVSFKPRGLWGAA